MVQVQCGDARPVAAGVQRELKVPDGREDGSVKITNTGTLARFSTSHSVDDINFASGVPDGMKPAISCPPTFPRYAARYRSAILSRNAWSVTTNQRHDC